MEKNRENREKKLFSISGLFLLPVPEFIIWHNVPLRIPAFRPHRDPRSSDLFHRTYIAGAWPYGRYLLGIVAPDV